MFVYRTIDCFSQTSTIDDRKRNVRPRVVRTNFIIKIVRERIRWNRLGKLKIMSREVIYRPDQCQDLFEMIFTWKLTVCQLVIFWQCAWRKLGSTDTNGFFSGTQKNLSVEEVFNKQNEKIFVKTSKGAKNVIPRVQRSHHTAAIMVLWGVSCTGVTPVHFSEKIVKTGWKVY